MSQTVDILSVARFMYERNVQDYIEAGGEPDLVDRTWRNDAGVRQFWTSEAEAVLGFIGFAGVE